MFPVDRFRFCPGCGSARPAAEVGTNPLRCRDCSFSFFFNPTVAAGAFLFDAADRALFIRRANDPAKGSLAIPGGFIDVGETLESGLRREIEEEVGLAVAELQYVCSDINDYIYDGVTYPVVDCIFTGRVTDPNAARSLDGVAGIEWCMLRDVREDDLAFASIRAGRRALLREQSGQHGHQGHRTA